MASPTQWTWVWASSESWWWTGKSAVLQSRGRKESERTEQLNWTEHGPTHQNQITKKQIIPQPVPPIRKLPQASSPDPSEGRQNKNHSHRKLTKLITWITALSKSMKLWAIPCKTPETDGSQWRGLTKRGPLERGMANHFSILALRIPRTVWKCKKIWHWEMTPQICRYPICYWRRMEK